MAAWTVMTPKAASVGDAVFVRDGFNWNAAVFGPFWALINRMWIVAIVLGVISIFSGLLPAWLAITANLGMMLVAGIFAGDLKLWSLARRGFREAGVLNAANCEEAEVRFFAGQLDALPAPAKRLAATNGSDPLGLFGSTW